MRPERQNGRKRENRRDPEDDHRDVQTERIRDGAERMQRQDVELGGTAVRDKIFRW